MNKAEKKKQIRESGYTGTILECRCGWIGKVSDLKTNNEKELGCPECGNSSWPFDNESIYT